MDSASSRSSLQEVGEIAVEFEGLDMGAHDLGEMAVFRHPWQGQSAWPRCRGHSRSRRAGSVPAHGAAPGCGKRAPISTVDRLARHVGIDPFEPQMQVASLSCSWRISTGLASVSLWSLPAMSPAAAIADIGRQHDDRRRLAGLAQTAQRAPSHSCRAWRYRRGRGPAVTPSISVRHSGRRVRRQHDEIERRQRPRASVRGGPRCRRRP